MHGGVVRAVVKVGGSLLGAPRLRETMGRLAELAPRHGLLVVPGGGAFADQVRAEYARHRLSETAAHRMALLAMDQVGHLLADLAGRAAAVDATDAAAQALRRGLLPVLLPARWVLVEDALPHSWDVTSDSIAAWIARRAGARLLVLLKSALPRSPGRPPPEPAGGRPDPVGLRPIAADRLGDLVDRAFASTLHPSIRCLIVDGRRPDCLPALFTTGRAPGVEVVPCACSSA